MNGRLQWWDMPGFSSLGIFLRYQHKDEVPYMRLGRIAKFTAIVGAMVLLASSLAGCGTSNAPAAAQRSTASAEGPGSRRIQHVGDGTLLVSVENAPGLDRVNPATGRVTAAAHFTSTDDVIVRNGIAYVADLGGRTMSAVTLSSGTVHTLVTGIKAAQGLAMRADGTFLLANQQSGDIRVARGC